jgi:microcystin-dependent protein
MYDNQVTSYLGVHGGIIPFIEYMKYNQGPPSGSIIAYTIANSPVGWLLCDGSEIDRTKYARLFASIGTTFGEGDGQTTFKLPDYRGAFLRGTGANGLYSGPSLNASQTHATQTRHARAGSLEGLVTTIALQTTLSLHSCMNAYAQTHA